MNPFTEALRVLDERGWYQGGWQGPDGSVCMAGAVAKALSDVPLYFVWLDDSVWPAWTFLASRLPGVRLAEEANERIGRFNDDPRTSYEDVRLVLKHAAAAWDER